VATIVTTWAFAYLDHEERQEFIGRLAAASPTIATSPA
jgi:hypothetical protein